MSFTKKNSRGVDSYSTTHTSDAVFIIGGGSNTVAEFKDHKWRRMENLNEKRYQGGSITFTGQTMIIGGSKGNPQGM